MKQFARMIVRAALVSSLVGVASAQPVVINEIMFHPLQPTVGPEPLHLEYIELHNVAATNVSLAGWKLTKGVTFTFPAGASIPAGGFALVAANATALDEAYPFINNVYGNWVGTLANGGETLELVNAAGTTMDEVTYADGGDWGFRQRSPSLAGQRGWIWTCLADGRGRSLEKRNPSLPGNAGQNWQPSVGEGTPTVVNGARSSNIPPLILDVTHLPLVPKSSDPVTITARIVDELSTGIVATLVFRTNITTSPGNFANATMFDDGLHGDGVAADGIYGAILPPMPNDLIIEFYVHAADRSGNIRTWPGPAYEAADLGGAFLGQVANAALQVDDTVYPLVEPLYKLVMTPSEVNALRNIFGSSQSDAQANATVVILDGTGVENRYLCGVRNRGNGSRGAQVKNHRVNFPSDRPWRDVTALNINAQVVHAQVAGSQLAQRAGAAGANVHFARLLVNNGVGPGGITANGLYAANEAKDSDWSDRMFPDNGGGNVYLVQRNLPPPNFNYRGTDPVAYKNTYFKQSNAAADDWTDLIAMLEVMGEDRTGLFTMARARSVIDVEQWLRHLAVMSMFGNNESGINTGNNDDYYLYSRTPDRIFQLIYHDLDTVLGFGSRSANDGVFGATVCCISGDSEGIANAMNFFMHHPEVEPLYYRILQDLIDGPFSEVEFNSAVDTLFSRYTELSTQAATIKNYMAARRTAVQGMISGLVPPSTQASVATIAGAPRAVTALTTATLTVGGDGVTHYRASINNGAYGVETPIATPIALTGLANGSSNVVRVIGKNANGAWQSTAAATLASWVVNTAWPAVRLNEILARNVAATPHEGTFPDWVELYNEGATTVSLAGWRLTDDLAEPGKFVFPPGAQLAAGGYLVVYADAATTSGLHLGFGLGQSGDALYLLQPGGAGPVVDSVIFGPQIPDRTIGRYGNSGDWQLSQPTFAAVNQLQALGSAAGVKINEWFAASEPPSSEDYIELFNPGTLPAAIAGYYLTDQPIGRPAQHRIAPNSFISGNGFAVFVADNQVAAGPDHLNFRLSASVGSVALFSPALHVVDYVIYTPQSLGVSRGRCPDGGPTNVAQNVRTPGAANYCPTPPPPPPPPIVVNLLPVTATWRYYTNGVEPIGWKLPNYDDSGWNGEGPGVLGRARNGGFIPDPILTPLPTIPFVQGGKMTYYFRTHLTMPAGFSYTSLQLSNLVDDGAVFYVNGTEVGRFNMPGGTIASNTASASTITDAAWTLPNPAAFSTTNLQVGDNVVAVEVHQASSGTAGDVIFGLRLDGVIITNIPTVGSLSINEVVADNQGSLTVDGRTPDWIEFYNPTGTSIDMGGMSLSDRADDPTARWTFSAGSIVPAGGYFVIHADADAPASASNTGFGLNAKGGAVYLFNRAPKQNEIFDSIEYGMQTPDHSVARIPAGSANWRLGLPTPGGNNVAAALGNRSQLRINEWMADPESGDDWFELYNADSRPVALDGVRLTDTFADPNAYRVPALSFIGVGSNAFVRFEADNPSTPSGPEHVNFKLGKEGDSIYLLAPNSGPQIDAVTFGPQGLGVSQGRLPDGAATIVSFPQSSSPEDSNFLPLTDVVVNEVLAHTDLPLEDAIELRNLTGQTIDLSGWWLSDSKEVLRKYQLPAGTILPANGYRVFYEQQFNNDLNPAAFSLSSSSGDQVYLSQTTAGGALTGYRAVARFGPSANGVSFGRYVTSQGAAEFPPMSALTFGTPVTAQSSPDQINVFRTGTGAPNAYPKVGPIVISEIMYHPPDIGTNDNVIEEFIELRNIGTEIVPLFHPAYPTNGWRLRDAVSFQFNESHSIPPGGHLLVVSFDPANNPAALATFRAKYGPNAVLAGPYQGILANSSESIELLRPDEPQVAPSPDAGQVPYYLVERVVYADRNPWPTNADGGGTSLQRLSARGYGNDPTNWVAALPTPGPAGSTDSDFDGMPDDWELANGFNPNGSGDALLDADGDGLRNREEYLAGTDPRSGASSLRLTAVRVGASVELVFQAVAGRTYTILASDALADGWQGFFNVPAPASSGPITIPDNFSSQRTQRFYRIITPASP
jgi:hypothetical protein